MARTLTSHQSGGGSIPAVDDICGLRLLTSTVSKETAVLRR